MSSGKGLLRIALAGALAACGGAGSPAAEERVFDDAIEADPCAVLTTSDVAQATGVAAEGITRQEVSGCLYSWDGGSIWLAGVEVHGSVEKAKGSFARFTEDATAEEVEASVEQIREELAERRAAGEADPSRAGTEDAILDVLPGGVVTHDDLEGVGADVRLSSDGSVRIRFGNATVWFTGRTGDEERIDPRTASEVARRIIVNLEAM